MHPRAFTTVLLLSLVALLALPWIRVGDVHGDDPPRHRHNPQDRHPADFDPRLDYFYRLQAPLGTSGGDTDTLGALQETVGLLLADPSTDWSTVRIARLREHLVDLDRIMTSAEAEERPAPGGVAVTVTGDPTTLAALRRVVPAHVAATNGLRGWQVEVEDAGDALELALTAQDPAETEVLRALGFFGYLASGVNPRERHLTVARSGG